MRSLAGAVRLRQRAPIKLSRGGSGHQRGLISHCHPWFKSKPRNHFLSVRNLGYRESVVGNIKGRKPLIFDGYRPYSSQVLDQDIQSGRSSNAYDTPCLLDK
jgi:hypothetical protein